MTPESGAVARMRRELGAQLAERRKAAGYLQRELGRLAGYSRSVIANAETGGAGVGRQLWEQADRVLGTGELFVRGYDRIAAQLAAQARAGGARQATAEGRPAPGDQWRTAGQALAAYRERGWPAEQDGERVWLVTGTVIDVLEVPRQAGLVSVGWWLYTRGVPDEIRGLPALPDPAGALAVICAGPACYFLTASGACPWTHRDTAGARRPPVAGSVDAGTVRWHAGGGRVLAPPSRLAGGEYAEWVHVPAPAGQLVPAMALLHVLAQAVAASREGASLVLPGGIRAVPATARAWPGAPVAPGE
jgi:transcriptional regulator with XRE-family HTH domain